MYKGVIILASNPLLVKKALNLTKDICDVCKILDMLENVYACEISDRLFDKALSCGLIINQVVNGVFELVFMDKLRQALDDVLDVEYLLSICKNQDFLAEDVVSKVRKNASDLKRTLSDKIKSEVSRRSQKEQQDPFFNPGYSKYFDFSLLEEID